MKSFAHYKRHKIVFFYTMTVLLCVGFVRADNYLGKRLKLTGVWTGGKMRVERLQQRDASKDPKTGMVEGRIDNIDFKIKEFNIGPFAIEWNETTQFRGLLATELHREKFLEVKGEITKNGKFLAKNIELKEDLEDSKTIQFLGTVTAEGLQADSSVKLTVLGVSAMVSKEASEPATMLTRKLDDKRPEDQWTISLFNNPLTIGGEVEIDSSYDQDFEFDQDDDDILAVELGAELEFLYQLSKNVAFFLEGKLTYENDIHAENGDEESDTVIERGEMWLYLGRPLGSNFGLQIGRQTFQDEREWWWDEDLDAVRIYHNHKLFQFEIGLAQELAKTASNENRLDPEEEDVMRILFNGTISLSQSLRLDAFALYQHDYSTTENLNERLKEDKEDEIDSDIVWVGLRASGEKEFDSIGEINYWVDSAIVTGEETVMEFDDLGGNFIFVEDRNERDIEGWGVDLGASWLAPFSWEPTITLGYAIGSGDKDENSSKDNAFRQTGLEDNNNKFNGVDRFRYYGELFRPELSNLQIWTASLGFPLSKNSSIEMVYHHYQQVKATDFLRDVSIDADLHDMNKNRHVGDELDIVIGIEEWKHWEIELIGAIFWAGNAYGSLSGETAEVVALKVNYNF